MKHCIPWFGVLVLPTLAIAQGTAVVELHAVEPTRETRTIYFRVDRPSYDEARAAALNACNMERLLRHSGSVLRDLSYCEVTTVMDFEAAAHGDPNVAAATSREVAAPDDSATTIARSSR